MPSYYLVGFGLSKTKNKKILGAVIVIMAALGAVFLSSLNRADAAVGGPVCSVPADYATIQAAEDDAGCATIKVASGTYTENVVIDRKVNLKGAKAGAPYWSRTFGSASESKIVGQLTVQAADVTIDGFSITNPNQGFGIVVKTAGNNATVKNNIIDTIGAIKYPDGGGAQAIYLENGPDGVKVLRNKINNVQSDRSAKAIYIGDSTATDPSLNIRIDSNSISNVVSNRGAYGVHINNGSSTSPTAVGFTTVKIRSNKLNALTGNWVHAIGLEGETPNAVVKYNTISNLIDTDPTPIADASGVFFEANPAFYTAQVNQNDLAVGADNFGVALHPSLLAVYQASDLSVDGECNWWGAKNGPGGGTGSVGTGSGSKVTSNVDYKPWLKSSNLRKNCGHRDHHDWDDHHGDWKDHKDDWRDGRDD
jgi:hypothetical protein